MEDLASSDDDECADLDEWGWDPTVDQFLLEIVEEAPRQGPFIDFAWVSCQFLQVLEPSDNDVEAAMERFSPAALEERLAFLLQSVHETDVINEASVEPTSSCLHLPRSQSDNTCSAGSSTSDLGSVPSAINTFNPGGPPKRDRILEAMQNFLFEQPCPEKDASVAIVDSSHHEAILAAPSETASTRPYTERTEELSLSQSPSEPVSPTGLAMSLTAIEPSTATPASASAPVSPLREVTMDGEDKEQVGSAPFARRLCARGVGSSSGGSDALRRCLDELRWHGEALRRCAAGEDAAELVAEATNRRKLLLWSIGLGPDALR
eukprot:TRINITY_DN23042_c0_g1_i1.p1 TRINITY_DN23042_c0_g1~~TRINITY_DN23042_c0_g1_i1.p1  ORF type:complete len:321 (+),score=64.58 TRINITY_DN23042_c0_g1_i1:132-1094(+)